MDKEKVTWVAWTKNGRESTAHAAPVRSGDVSVGSFPLACGRWAPDGWDVDSIHASYGKRCARCERAVA